MTGAVSAAVSGGSGPADRAELVTRLRADPTILVLDNCEHVLRETAQLVELVARRCPDIRVVLTSRHRLGLPSELVLPLAPLPGPSTGTPSPSRRLSPAEVLLVDRIRRARPAFEVTEHNAPVLGEVCRRLDGLPLALELAASRVHQLGLEGVRAALAGDPGVLDKAAWTGQPMRALVDWSCDLLSDEEQDLFAALSVFPGEFGLEAVDRLVSGMRADDTQARRRCPRAAGRARRLLVGVGPRARRRSELLVAHGGAHRGGPPSRGVGTRCAGRGRACSVGCGAHRGGRRRLHRAGCHCGAAPAPAWACGHRGGLALGIALRRAEPRSGHRGRGAAVPTLVAATWLDELIIQAGERSLRDGGARAAEAMGAAGVALASRGVSAGAPHSVGGARAAASPTELYLAHLALGLASLYGGEHEESGRHWRAIADLAGLPVALRTEGHTSLALVARFAGDLDLALEQAEVAVLSADACGSAPVQAFAAYAAGEAAVAEPDQAIASLRRAADQATATGCVQIAVLARIALLAALVRAGHHGAAGAMGDPLLAEVRRMAMWPQLCTIGRIVAELATATDRPQEAALLMAAAAAQPGSPPAHGAGRASLRHVA